jgi:hypothetical protein
MNKFFEKVKQASKAVVSNQYVKSFVSTAAISTAVTAGAIAGTLLVNAAVEGIAGLLTKGEETGDIIDVVVEETQE